ncbi:MAG: DUF4825 domain-containing protein [Lachnospiraceae bacterium]|nr:DUF4825 domain-containing protein [Lachnospiraceae bacterium]
MSNKIPCDVIRDLLPSYVDELTSETSNTLIMEHMRGCESCRKTLASMQGGLPFAEEAEKARREIDFLKKNKRRNRRIVFGSIAGAFLLILAVLAARVFIVGSRDYTNWIPANLTVEGRNLTFTAVPTDSAMAVSGLDFREEDGVITVSGRSVLVSPLHRGNCAGVYTSSGEIREVRIGGRIVWADGATVSALAADLFETRHDYVGDMPANNRTAQALNLGSYLGAFTNELETKEEPFGWKILLEEEISSEKLEQKERDMDAFGRVMIGLVGNLDHVTFVYTADGREETRTITAAEASAFLGQDIKRCGTDVRILDELIRKTGLSMYAFSDETAGVEEEMWLAIVNETDLELLTVCCGYYKNGKLRSESYGQNADGSAVKAGERFWVSMEPRDFGSFEESPVLELAFSFETPDGREIALPDRLRVAAAPGNTYQFILTGNETDGLHLE